MKLLFLTSMIGLAAAAGTSLAADAVGTKPAPQCFRSHDIRNHTSDGKKTLYLSVNMHDTYKVTMSDNCLAAAMPSDPLVIRSMGASDNICRPLDLDIGVRSNGFTSRCIVANIAPMTPAEVAALPPKLRP